MRRFGKPHPRLAFLQQIRVVPVRHLADHLTTGGPRGEQPAADHQCLAVGAGNFRKENTTLTRRPPKNSSTRLAVINEVCRIVLLC